MALKLRRYAVLIGWRDPAGPDPHTMQDSGIFRVGAPTAPQAIESAIVHALRPPLSPQGEIAAIHVLSPSEEAEIAFSSQFTHPH